MKNLYTILKTTLLAFLTSSLALGCVSIPKLSKEAKQTINKVIKEPIPELIKGETGFAINDGNKIWYENIPADSRTKGTVLLIMGNGQDALSWPPEFISNFTKSGYQVIRYDHRGTGWSTYGQKWKKKNAYSLNDMAQDALVILDTLKIQKAHVVGVSMGGMIAQLIAIEHPERTETLTSIMSSGDVLDTKLSPMSNEVMPKIISTVLKHGFFGNAKGQIKRQIIQKRILMGKASGEIDVKNITQNSFYNLKKRKGYNLLTAKHHYIAIINTKPRYKALSRLTLPTLIIHGAEDPMMPIEHGEKLAATISNSKSLFVKNMGHDLPDSAIDEITDTIISNFERSLK